RAIKPIYRQSPSHAPPLAVPNHLAVCTPLKRCRLCESDEPRVLLFAGAESMAQRLRSIYVVRQRQMNELVLVQIVLHYLFDLLPAAVQAAGYAGIGRERRNHDLRI